jgi:hypothetical protein
LYCIVQVKDFNADEAKASSDHDEAKASSDDEDDDARMEMEDAAARPQKEEADAAARSLHRMEEKKDAAARSEKEEADAADDADDDARSAHPLQQGSEEITKNAMTAIQNFGFFSMVRRTDREAWRGLKKIDMDSMITDKWNINLYDFFITSVVYHTFKKNVFVFPCNCNDYAGVYEYLKGDTADTDGYLFSSLDRDGAVIILYDKESGDFYVDWRPRIDKEAPAYVDWRPRIDKEAPAFIKWRVEAVNTFVRGVDSSSPIGDVVEKLMEVDNAGVGRMDDGNKFVRGVDSSSPIGDVVEKLMEVDNAGVGRMDDGNKFVRGVDSSGLVVAPSAIGDVVEKLMEVDNAGADNSIGDVASTAGNEKEMFEAEKQSEVESIVATENIVVFTLAFLMKRWFSKVTAEDIKNALDAWVGSNCFRDIWLNECKESFDKHPDDTLLMLAGEARWGCCWYDGSLRELRVINMTEDEVVALIAQAEDVSELFLAALATQNIVKQCPFPCRNDTVTKGYTKECNR